MKDDNLLNDEGNEKTILSKSSIVDGTEVNGFGYVNNRTYKWRLAIESNIKSISQIPNKFLIFMVSLIKLQINKQLQLNLLPLQKMI